MAQLLMKFRAPRPGAHRPLPEGYTLSTCQTDEDALGWIAACAEGLSTDAWTLAQFRQNMLEPQGLAPEQIFLVKDPQGRVAATATGWIKGEDCGYLHMVAALPEYRGLGLGAVVCQAVLDFFAGRGIARILLNSDDWRLAALKTYLNLGFLPVLNDFDMADRWQAIYEKLGVRYPVYRVRLEEAAL